MPSNRKSRALRKKLSKKVGVDILWSRPGYRRVEPVSHAGCVTFDYNQIGRSRHAANERRDAKLGV